MFVLTDITMEIIFSILFLILNNADIQFSKRKLIWKIYIPKKDLSNIWKIEFIDKK